MDAFFDNEGKRRWSYSSDYLDIFRCPSPLAGGGFSVLRKRSVEESESMGGYQASDLVFYNRKGKIVDEVSLMQSTEWLLANADGYYAIGYHQDTALEEGDKREVTRPLLSRLDSKGYSTWSFEYTNSEYSNMTFKKGAISEDSIIIMGDAYNIKHQAGVGMLYRMDMNGNVIWNTEATLGNDSHINDFCVTDDGLIAGIYTNIIFDEEFGFPAGRVCSVFLMNMNGETLWEYALENGLILDYIPPVTGGFLCGSRGLDLENCPYIGSGSLLLLDREGKVKAADSTPDIGGGRYELFGLSKSRNGEALLYGTMLDEPGFPSAPFVARLNFPEAYH